MFNLSDDELSQLMAAAAPLDPDRRDAFVKAVAAEVAACSTRGPDSTHQVIAKIQRQFWHPPILDSEPLLTGPLPRRASRLR
jgi:hypothetical protein